MKNKTLIVIVGPTAIGKTSLGVKVAQHFKTEVISADSRQFFKEMNIGTAKPTSEEKQGIPHHFVDFLSITERYTAGQFEQDAIRKIEGLFTGNDYVVMVGGSGLYVDAVCKGIDDIPTDLTIREQLNRELKTNGLEPLQERLKQCDPLICETINLKNPQRVVRALEVFEATGKPYSSFRIQAPKQRNFTSIKIGLNTERQIVYDRINRRVDIMMQNGLLEEVESLLPYKHLNALNTVGYKEFFDYFLNKITVDEAIEKVKKNTRNFAKRQLTWFRKDKSTHWIEPQEFEKVVSIIEKV